MYRLSITPLVYLLTTCRSPEWRAQKQPSSPQVSHSFQHSCVISFQDHTFYPPPIPTSTLEAEGNGAVWETRSQAIPQALLPTPKMLDIRNAGESLAMLALHYTFRRKILSKQAYNLYHALPTLQYQTYWVRILTLVLHKFWVLYTHIVEGKWRQCS